MTITPVASDRARHSYHFSANPLLEIPGRRPIMSRQAETHTATNHGWPPINPTRSAITNTRTITMAKRASSRNGEDEIRSDSPPGAFGRNNSARRRQLRLIRNTEQNLHPPSRLDSGNHASPALNLR